MKLASGSCSSRNAYRQGQTSGEVCGPFSDCQDGEPECGQAGFAQDHAPIAQHLQRRCAASRRGVSDGVFESLVTQGSLVHFSADNDEGDLYVIERLVKQRKRRRKQQSLVHWQGLPDSEDTWENEASIRHVAHWGHLLKELRSRRR